MTGNIASLILQGSPEMDVNQFGVIPPAENQHKGEAKSIVCRGVPIGGKHPTFWLNVNLKGSRLKMILALPPEQENAFLC